MEAVYPTSGSALARGRRLRRREPRERRRTTPVTFAEIKEVDEEGSGEGVQRGGARRRADVVDERLGRPPAEGRRRAAHVLRELSPAPPAPEQGARALSEPAALHRHEDAARRDAAADT